MEKGNKLDLKMLALVQATVSAMMSKHDTKGNAQAWASQREGSVTLVTLILPDGFADALEELDAGLCDYCKKECPSRDKCEEYEPGEWMRTFLTDVLRVGMSRIASLGLEQVLKEALQHKDSSSTEDILKNLFGD